MGAGEKIASVLMRIAEVGGGQRDILALSIFYFSVS